MRTASVTELKVHLSDYLDQIQEQGPIVVTRNGKVVAMLSPFDDDDLEMMQIAQTPQFQAMIEQSRQSIKDGKGLTSEEFWKLIDEQSKD